MYKKNKDFGHAYKLTECGTHDNYFHYHGHLCYVDKLCIPKCSLWESLVGKAHDGGLIGHNDVNKTISILQEHFYWPHL